MASVTVDGQSLSINGKRLWIVSGTIHYARLPRERWRDHLLAARQAGLNTVEAPVVWAAHEPREGHFAFEDDLDLAHFLRLAAELRLRVILRVGPYVGDGYDLGGLPPWLIPAVREQADAAGATGKAGGSGRAGASRAGGTGGTGGASLSGGGEGSVRGANPAFLHATSRWFAKLASQVADLQVTRRPRKGVDGPIVLVQAEHEWFCAHDATADAYLAELARYLRENSINVPIVNTNNLYQSIEGQIDAWSGFTHLHAIARQLRTIRPSHPRFVLSLKVGAPDVWGEERRSRKTPAMVASALAQTLAAGAQFNVSPLAGASAPAFSGARADGSIDRFLTTNRDDAGPITHTGARTPMYNAVRRVATFASSFERLLAALDPDDHHVAISPDDVAPPVADEATGAVAASKPDPSAPTVAAIHAPGAQGSATFLFADPTAPASRPHRATLILPDGSALPVTIPTDLGVAWIVRDAHLIARSTLDYSNLSPFTLVGRVLVVFGQPGAHGVMSINTSPFEITVPTGKRPVVEIHEDIVVVVCSTDQIDATYTTHDSVLVGVAGLDRDHNPIPHPGFKQIVRIDQTGEERVESASTPARRPAKPTLSAWHTAPETENAGGTSVRYARIAGPDSMEALGAPSGYAWLRLTLKNPSTKKARAAMFQSADRLHVYDEGTLINVYGTAPGANNDPIVNLALRRGTQTLSVLVDNLGRYDAGNALGQPKGLHGHVYEVKNLRAPAPKLVDEDLIDPLTFRAPIFGLRFGDVTDASRLTWTIQHRRKSPILMSLEPKKPLEDIVLVILNGEPVHLISPGHNLRAVFDPEILRRGKNVIQLAVVGDMREHGADLKGATSFYEGAASLTEKAEWAFAKWEPPPEDAFEEVAKSALSASGGRAFKGVPRWWKATFGAPPTTSTSEHALLLDASGLSKGQIFLNGRNLCRYFVATRTGKAVPPQRLYHLPSAYLDADGENTLLIFDEHGFAPGKVKLVYE